MLLIILMRRGTTREICGTLSLEPDEESLAAKMIPFGKAKLGASAFQHEQNPLLERPGHYGVRRLATARDGNICPKLYRCLGHQFSGDVSGTVSFYVNRHQFDQQPRQ
jgi:hypothetical protein